MPNMIKKILIVGYGSIGKKHFINLKKILPKAKIALLTSQKIKKNNIEIFNSLTLAKKFKPQVVFICNEATQHIKYAIFFYKLNCHLLIEKPVGTKKKDLEKFLKLMKKKNSKTVMAGYNLRFEPSFIFFKKKIKEKLIGKILSVRSEVGQFLPSWRKRDYKKSVSASKKSGGGVIFELSHDVDLLLELFDDIKLVNGLNYKASNMKIDTEDTAHAIFKSRKFNKNFLILLTMDFFRHDFTRTCTIIGSKATLKWDAIKKKVYLYKDGSLCKKFSFYNTKKTSYINQVRFLVKSIKNKNSLYKYFFRNKKLLEILLLLKGKKCFV